MFTIPTILLSLILLTMWFGKEKVQMGLITAGKIAGKLVLTLATFGLIIYAALSVMDLVELIVSIVLS